MNKSQILSIMSEDRYYIIYCITNIVNKKVYIGKTKSHYGDKKYGVQRRFERHFFCALSDNIKYRNDCPRLYNAIRKYGVKSFKIEEILRCDLDFVNQFEIAMINTYDSTNTLFGYNISKGGGGRSVSNVSEEVRLKISQSQTIGEMNIKPVVDTKETIIGYRVSRRENGIPHRKYFTSLKFTPEQNLQRARKWIDELKNGTLVNNPYNVRRLVQPGIIERYAKGNLVGYSVIAPNPFQRPEASFTSNKFSLEQKLLFAQQYLQTGFSNYESLKRPVDRDMKNITVTKNKQGIVSGYCAKIIVDGQHYKKSFEKKSLTMDEKYLLAVEWRDSKRQELESLRKNEREYSSKEDGVNPQPSFVEATIILED